MKIIEGITNEIILEDNDEIIISTLHGNKTKIKITTKNGSLHIEDIAYEKIYNISEEEKAIRAMKEYKRNHPKK